jgi:hypothetical protein
MEYFDIYKLVFRQGMVRNGTKENHVLPIVITKYEQFCSDLVNQKSNEDLEQLYMAADLALRFWLRNPDIDLYSSPE